MSIPIPILGAVILVGLVLGIIFMIGLTKKWGMLVPFAGMLLFASMSLPLDWNNRINPTVWLPIQQKRSMFFLASGIMGLVVLLFQSNRFRNKSISVSATLLVCIGFYASLIRFVHVGPSDALITALFFTCTALPLMFTSTIVMDSIEDFVSVLHAVLVTNVIWICMVFVQIAINPKFVTSGNEFRFTGLLANPQHTGVLMPYLCVISLWLLLNGSKKLKLIYIAILGINIIFLMWTGSRTGLGMTLIGVSSVLYTRTGRAILLLPFAGILSYVIFKIMINVLGIELGFGRLTSTANTRDHAWKNLIRIGMDNPIIGVGTYESENSENSWLYGFASYGIGMLALLILFAFTAMIEALKNIRLRFLLPHHLRPHIDLVTGAIGMYFAGALLEGYIISRVSSAICFAMLFLSAGSFIRKLAKQQNSADDEHYDHEHFYEPGDYGDDETENHLLGECE